MRSTSTFFKLTGVLIIMTALIITGANQINVRAGAPAQGTMDTSMAGTPASMLMASMAATSAKSGGAAAASSMTFPPCPTNATMAATGDLSGMLTTMSATDTSMMAATPSANPGYLGIKAEQVEACGSRVVEVIKGSAAEKAGIVVDDVVVGVDGKAAGDITVFRLAIQTKSPGQQAVLSIQRAGRSMDVTVTLGSKPADVQTPVASMAATQ